MNQMLANLSKILSICFLICLMFIKETFLKFSGIRHRCFPETFPNFSEQFIYLFTYLFIYLFIYLFNK